MNVEKIELGGNLKESLKNVLVSAHINKDSLARTVPQDVMFRIDELVIHFSGMVYANMLLAYEKAKDEQLQLCHDQIQGILQDIQNIISILYKTEIKK